MAQFNFLGTWEDSWAILTAILEPGDVCLIPDLHYDAPRPLEKRVVDEELKRLLKVRRGVYLWSDSFSIYPPIFRIIPRGTSAGKFFLDISKGGPALELTLPACYQKEGSSKLHLAQGILSYQREWWNPDTDEWEAATAEVKAGYQETVRRLKTRVVRRRFEVFSRIERRRIHINVWVGVDALKQIQENNAQIHGCGVD